MIVLYRTDPCEVCDEAAAALADLVVAHRVEVVGRGDRVADLPTGTTLPAIVDGGRVFAGDAIPKYLAELGRTIADWNRFQSDACYIDDDGTVC